MDSSNNRIFSLVKFVGENLYRVCSTSNIKHDSGQNIVKWKGTYYIASRLFSGRYYEVKSLCDNMNNGYPLINLSNFKNDEHFECNDRSEKDPYETDSASEYLPSDESLSEASEFSIKKNVPPCTMSRVEMKNIDMDHVTNTEINSDTANSFSPLRIENVACSKSGTKKYFCHFCYKLVTKFTSHIEHMHRDEDDVKEIIIIPKGYAERKVLIDKLRKKGSFIFNTQNAHNNGGLIVARRPANRFSRKENDFKVCPNCNGFYSKSAIRRHFLKCDPRAKKGERTLSLMSNKTRGQISKNANKALKTDIFPKLRDDEVTRIIRYDELAIAYGNRLCMKYRKPHLQPMIRNRLRLIGRLLISIKKINTFVTDFASIFHPKFYDDVVSAVNDVAVLNNKDMYKSPSTAFALGTLLKKTGKTLINEYIKKEQEHQVKITQNFLSLLEEDFACAVNKTVEENQAEMRRRKQIRLPSIEDIKLLNQYLNTRRDQAYHRLNNEFNYVDWKDLTKLTLISVQVFNRRRAGEIERILIEDFECLQSISEDLNKEVFFSLTKESQSAAKEYVRFEIRGKRGRGVPVLLHKKLQLSIECILKYRELAGVSTTNRYIFGLPGDNNKFLRACPLMRKFSILCGAKEPSLLRGTELRKHIATRSVLLHLEEHEVSDLANFLGHADKIHKEHYRIPIVARDITRMSRLLEIAQGDEVTEGEYFSENPPRNVDEIDFQMLDNSGVSVLHASREKNCVAFIDKHPPERSNGTGNNCKKKRSGEYFSENPPRNVDEIDFQMLDNSGVSVLHASREKNCVAFIDKHPPERSNGTGNNCKKKRSVSPVGRVKRTSWTSEEKEIVLSIFHKNIKNNKLPSIGQCSRTIEENSLLKNRSPMQLKTWISNQMRKMENKRKRNRESTIYWTEEEKYLLHRLFATNLATNTLPSLRECQAAVTENPVLRKRSRETVKAWLNNQIRRQRAAERI